MKINRNNYEIFFIDYLDNNLSQSNLLEFMAFLAENPDLEDELNNIKNVKLISEKIDFVFKSDLKKSAITSESFYELCIKYIENEINIEEKNELFDAIKQNPTFKNEFELFKLTVLKLDNSISFSNKSALKRRILNPYYKNIIKFASVAAAAIVLFVIVTQIIGFYNKKDNSVKIYANSKHLNKNNSIKSITNAQTQFENKLASSTNNKRKNLTKYNNKNIVIDTAAKIVKVDEIEQPDSNLKNIEFNKVSQENSNNSIANNEQKNNKYLDTTLNAVFKNSKYSHFRDTINNMPHESITASNSEFTNRGVWDVIKASTNGINYITGSQIEIENNVDNKKHIKRFSLKIGKIGFSRITHK